MWPDIDTEICRSMCEQILTQIDTEIDDCEDKDTSLCRQIKTQRYINV